MIKISKNPNGDTRTAPKGITFEEFQKANDSHIADVSAVMASIGECITIRGRYHDFTKKTDERGFYKDFVDAMENGSNFVEGEWYKKHVRAERHHLLSYCPEDVDLIDVIEMLVDCICAGLARSGEVRPIELNDDILKRAVQNTIEYLKDEITVE